MTIVSKFTLIAAIAAAGIASPALAQSLNPEAGSGNVAGIVPLCGRFIKYYRLSGIYAVSLGSLILLGARKRWLRPQTRPPDGRASDTSSIDRTRAKPYSSHSNSTGNARMPTM